MLQFSAHVKMIFFCLVPLCLIRLQKTLCCELENSMCGKDCMCKQTRQIGNGGKERAFSPCTVRLQPDIERLDYGLASFLIS